MTTPHTPGPNLTGRSILVVEDEFYLALEMQEEIERAGGVVVGPFADVGTGLASLARDSADCALIDINLGDGPTFEMADALQACGVPFVFLTGYDRSVVPERFHDIQCVQKPATIAMLLQTLERQLAG